MMMVWFLLETLASHWILWLLPSWRGATAEEIVEQYPSLLLADVYSVISYYLRRKSDVDAYLKIRQERAAQVRQKKERRFNPIGIRDLLMARLNHQRQG